MTETATGLSAWESFYVIVGSSAGALIGLQFVVITLIADRRQLTTPSSVAAFGTPTVVHLTGALVVSAIMSAPWASLAPAAAAIGLCGLFGIVYGVVVVGRARRQTAYQPVLEDWLWHMVFPFVSYAALTASAVELSAHPQRASGVIGAAALGVLLIGIHNAWDTVTHIIFVTAETKSAKKR
jgi:xanthosine utilization system XapX-like protein